MKLFFLFLFNKNSLNIFDKNFKQTQFFEIFLFEKIFYSSIDHKIEFITRFIFIFDE
jgi:hypothetical protein